MTRRKKHRTRKKGIPIVFDRCKGCERKFGYDFDGHTVNEYHFANQPKWIVKIRGQKWFYCSDKCVSRDFKKVRKTENIHYTPMWSYFILIGFFGYKKSRKWTFIRWIHYKKNTKIKFKMNLTKAYKFLKKHPARI